MSKSSKDHFLLKQEKDLEQALSQRYYRPLDIFSIKLNVVFFLFLNQNIYVESTQRTVSMRWFF